MSLAALLLAVASPPVATPVPTGPWIVEDRDGLCLLQHAYTLGEQNITLAFQPLLDLPTMDVFVVTDDRYGPQYHGVSTVKLGSAAQAITGPYFSVYQSKAKSRYTRLTVARGALDDLSDDDSLGIQAPPVNLLFKMARPEKARVALANCVANLKRSWGIDPTTADRVVTPLEGDPARYFGPQAYPREAIRERVYGRVIALLNIGVDGSVENCRIVSSAGAALNTGTCKAARRIRFRPARDKDGQGVATTYVLPVRWTLPGAPY